MLRDKQVLIVCVLWGIAIALYCAFAFVRATPTPPAPSVPTPPAATAPAGGR
jgi:hypothetical protein